LLSEGHEGRGWSRFYGELSKVKAEGMRGPPSGTGPGLRVFLEPQRRRHRQTLDQPPWVYSLETGLVVLQPVLLKMLKMGVGLFRARRCYFLSFGHGREASRRG